MNPSPQRKWGICPFAHTSLFCQAIILLILVSVFLNANYQSNQPSLLQTSSSQQETTVISENLREIHLLRQELEKQRYKQKEEKLVWKNQAADFKKQQGAFWKQQEIMQRRLDEQRRMYEEKIGEFDRKQNNLEVALRVAREDIRDLQNDAHSYNPTPSNLKTKASLTGAYVSTNKDKEIPSAHTSTGSRKETRVIVTLSIRPRKGTRNAGHYCYKRFMRMDEYAKSVGADFFLVNTTDHESIRLENPDLDVHYYKFIVIQYYLERYDAVLWFDDTIKINPDCECTPNIFELSDDTVAARDVTRPEMAVLCARIRETPAYWARYNTSEMFAEGAKPCRKLKHQKNFPQFNAGLMSFRKKHLKIFYDFRETWEMVVQFEQKAGDQAVFNFLLYFHGFEWFNINQPIDMVQQGSKLVSSILEDTKLTCIGHVTKGSRHWRHALLCDDWDFCMREDYFTTNETIVSPIKYVNKNSLINHQHKDNNIFNGAFSWNEVLNDLDCLTGADEESKIDQVPMKVPNFQGCQFVCESHQECGCIVLMDDGCTRLFSCNPATCTTRPGAATVIGSRSVIEQTSNKGCPLWCGGNVNSDDEWEDKCTWNACSGCEECQTVGGEEEEEGQSGEGEEDSE